MKRNILTMLLACAAGSLLAANTITTVSQVASVVTLSDDVDYVITSSSPFTGEGIVDITNTEHAVLIIENLKPSKVISYWLRYVRINGEKATNGVNCQVRMYAQGAIVFPYSKDLKPLTVYSEKNFEGNSCNDFGLENTGGFMNTLSDAKLNNQIRSFRLKRGHMVTFSTRKEGRGYSRCFIADKEDLEVKTLPTVLDQTISSYRVFQWYDAEKKSLANNTSSGANDALNVTSCYSFGPGESRLPDQECIPHHIYEGWPAADDLGSRTYSCHMKTNNEPGNSADDHPQDVATVLAGWEELMRTGMRLCSESSHDGSWSHLRAFIDSIDARGWRCDILDLHCYWSGGFNNMQNYYNSYGQRPIWISEWVWGASWNNNGVFASNNRTQQSNVNELKNIIPVLNASPYVERYFYWNDEQDYSKIYKDGALTLSGEYYASVKSGLGYNKNYEKIPNTPRMYNPKNLSASYDKVNRKVILKWHEFNGEYNQSMVIQYKKPNGSTWNTLQSVPLQELEADYEVAVEGTDGYKYRILLRDVKSLERLSNEATAVNENLEVGDQVTLGDKTMYLGGNILPNGGFDFGLAGWTNGLGEPLSAPYFQAVPCGGIDDGPYLQTYGSSDQIKDAASVSVRLSLQQGASYYVGAAGCNTGAKNQKITTTYVPSIELYSRVAFSAVSQWSLQGNSFTVNLDTILFINLRSLAGTAQFDEFKVCRLFDTEAEALEDALQCAERRAQLFVECYQEQYPEIAKYVASETASALDAKSVESAIQTALDAIQAKKELLAARRDLQTIEDNRWDDLSEVKQNLLEAYQSAEHPDFLLEWNSSVQSALSSKFQYSVVSDLISNPTFASAADWNQVGTYQGGDQRIAVHSGQSCWNAWWSTPASNSSATMEVRQTLEGLPHGFYALECKGATQHLCETDQHGYLSYHGDSMCTPSIPVGALDLPMAASRQWNTLVTPYIYVDEKDTISVGFVGSKQGAVDGRWMPYGNPTGKGDNREGWWCATDFRLRYMPVYLRKADSKTWGTICLPYKFTPGPGVYLYQIAGQYGGEICVEPYEQPETVPGTPYLFRTAPYRNATFFESKDKSVITAKTNVKGLRGSFSTTIKYPVGSLVLQEGKWTYIESKDASFQIAPYSGYIYKVSNVPVLDSWSGETIPADSRAGLGISAIECNDAESAPAFNLSGQRTSTAEGLVISGGKVIFVK